MSKTTAMLKRVFTRLFGREVDPLLLLGPAERHYREKSLQRSFEQKVSQHITNTLAGGEPEQFPTVYMIDGFQVTPSEWQEWLNLMDGKSSHHGVIKSLLRRESVKDLLIKQTKLRVEGDPRYQDVIPQGDND